MISTSHSQPSLPFMGPAAADTFDYGRLLESIVPIGAPWQRSNFLCADLGRLCLETHIRRTEEQKTSS